MSHMGSFTNPQTGDTMVTLTNASGGTASAGSPVYMSAAASFGLAVATSFAAALAVGFVPSDIASAASGSVQTSGVLTLTTAQWDARTGGSGGLTFGTPYYLDVTAGKMTATAPSAVGQFVTLLGVALSTTQLRLLIQPPVGL
ncbi:MAG TPA: capsid cement protein [Pseudolabrys sp.]